MGEYSNGHRWPVHSVAWSPDGECIASGSGEDFGSGNEIKVHAKDGGLKWSVTGHGDASCTCTMDYDTALRVVNVRCPVNGHFSSVQSVMFGPGNTLASGSADSTVMHTRISRPASCGATAHACAYHTWRTFACSRTQVKIWDNGSLKCTLRGRPCTCLYACLYTCLYACLYTCLYACLHTCTHVCTSVYTHVYTHVYAHAYTCLYTCLYMSIHMSIP